MWKIIAISFFSLVVTAPTNFDYTPLNEFAIQLLQNTYAFQESLGVKNIAVSPVSVWSIFSLLAEGAVGETFQELMKSLRLPNDMKATQNLHSAVNDVLTGNEDVILNHQSAIFNDCSLEVLPEFCQAATTYKTDIYSVDPSNTTKLASDINYYVCIATEGRIKNAVRPDLLEDLRMILIDALFFKAAWKTPFDPTQTKQDSFYNSQGKSIGFVNMMYQKSSHNIGDLPQIGAQFLEMTYGKSGQYSMIFLLPFDGIPIHKLISNLESPNWISELKTLGSVSAVDVYIPRFKISSQTDLIPALKYSGIHSIFDVQSAQLPGVSNSPLFVSRTVQNVEVEVTEDGTTAAGSTVVGLEDRILGPRFEANKEFVFLITEKKSNLILFSGVYSEPFLL